MLTGRSRRSFLALVALILGVGAAVPQRAAADPPDPLIPMINRINSYFHRHELDGITKDARYNQNPEETIRLSIVSQLLGFCDLYAADPRPGYYQDIVDRADFVTAHVPEILSHSAFDGMAAYSLLQAYDVTHDARYLATAIPILEFCKSLTRFQNTLNWGLMSAMGLAKYWAITGDPSYLDKTREILESCREYQHADGSFPHYCINATDVHYSGWMGMELLHIERYVSDPSIEPMLQAIESFLDGRIDSAGVTSYSEPCTAFPGCVRNYYSYGTGCTIDYDTRGWINELGYTAMVFDHFDTPKFNAVTRFLYSLGPHGVFPDKWAFFPPDTDAIYPWASADSSVIRTSVVFWSLASIYRTRYAPVAQLRTPATGVAALTSAHGTAGTTGATGTTGADIVYAPDGEPDPHGGSPGPRRAFEWFTVDSLAIAGVDPSTVCVATPIPAATAAVGDAPGGGEQLRLRALQPNPTTSGAAIAFTLARSSRVTLAIYDATGRRVRVLASAPFPAGEQRVRWDGRDDSGHATAAGLYFVSVRAGAEQATGRLLVVR